MSNGISDVTGSTNDEDAIDTAPEEAFATLGNELRIQILKALWAAPDEPVSFSTLRKLAGTPDSGQFNYHLRRLVGRFIRQTDAGYELTFAGRRVIGAIVSGTYTTHKIEERFEVSRTDSACCGASITIEYADEEVTVRCADCERLLSQAGFPAKVFERHAPEDFPRVFNRWLLDQLTLMKDGLCPNCDGQMTASIVTDPEYLDRSVGIEYICEHCKNTATSSIAASLLDHPAVVSFYHDHGIDLREKRTWTLPWLADEYTQILSDDPWRIEVMIILDESELTLTVDEHLTVVEQRTRSE